MTQDLHKQMAALNNALCLIETTQFYDSKVMFSIKNISIFLINTDFCCNFCLIATQKTQIKTLFITFFKLSTTNKVSLHVQSDITWSPLLGNAAACKAQHPKTTTTF